MGTPTPIMPLRLLLASPRGFCAGVDRAIQIVERALEKHGQPVYVRHEIVHNKYVVESLEARGAIFVDELDQVPDGVPVVFSAHGVPKTVPAAAEERGLDYLDATCPLVSKVHVDAGRHNKAGRHVILIGHKGHPEVIGTMGQLPDGTMTLVETIGDVEALEPDDISALAYVTQTTLSVDDTAGIVKALQDKFPLIEGPHKEDICYATTNRQEAVKALAAEADLILVIGAPNSSNSVRLVEVAQKAGCPQAYLVQSARQIDWSWFTGCRTMGLTAGASAPEILIQDVIKAVGEKYEVSVENLHVRDENVTFKLPRSLSA